MVGKRLERVVVGFGIYSHLDNPQRVKRFLEECQADYVYLGSRIGGSVHYFAVKTMELDESWTVSKNDGQGYWIVRGSNGDAFCYIEFGELAAKKYQLVKGEQHEARMQSE